MIDDGLIGRITKVNSKVNIISKLIAKNYIQS